MIILRALPGIFAIFATVILLSVVLSYIGGV